MPFRFILRYYYYHYAYTQKHILWLTEPYMSRRRARYLRRPRRPDPYLNLMDSKAQYVFSDLPLPPLSLPRYTYLWMADLLAAHLISPRQLLLCLTDCLQNL